MGQQGEQRLQSMLPPRLGGAHSSAEEAQQMTNIPITYLATRKAAPTPGRECQARSVTCGKEERQSRKGQGTVKRPRRVSGRIKRE